MHAVNAPRGTDAACIAVTIARSASSIAALMVVALSVVVAAVFAMQHEPEVFNSVVLLVSVDVVHIFLILQSSTEALFHNPSVLSVAVLFTVDPDFALNVAFGGNVPALLLAVVTAVVRPHTRA